jgi:pyruvate dehydrogenase E2 component (dihydrolipoamide acetyltransferase)
MSVNVLMPALSPTMEKGNLSKWLKKEGDVIKSGDVLAEIETDKATMEVEAVDEGILAKIMVPAGTNDVPVNQLIAVIASEGETISSIAAAPASAAAAAPAAAPSSAAPSSAAPSSAAPAPAAVTAPVAVSHAPQGVSGSKVFASPLAKRIAKDGGLDLSRVTGSGPHGRIVERDVRAALAGGVSAPKPVAPSVSAPVASPSVAPAISDDQTRKLFTPGSFDEIPHDGMRRTIARRLTEARQTVPQFYLTMDCDIDALLKLREQINASAPKDKEGKVAWKVSVNDMVIKALALALVRVPDANVTWTESAMLKHHHADVGVAVALPGNGLITPIIRKADTVTLSGIALAMKDFAARAKSRKLKPEEYQGGTTAVSNLGMFGIKDFTAVINPPHSTILAVGAGEQRAVVKNGALAIATVMSITLSCDHRAVDGALGAELIAAIKVLIENPLSLLV